MTEDPVYGTLHTVALHKHYNRIHLMVKDGQDKPIAYPSRSLAPAERNYSRLEKEGLAYNQHKQNYINTNVNLFFSNSHTYTQHTHQV